MDLPCNLLLHPELLSNDQLIHNIQQRQLKIPNIATLQRCELLEIFHQYCVPHGQRTYRDTGRGKILNKTRNIGPEAKPKVMPVEAPPCLPEQNRKHTQPWIHERLKPPPELAAHVKRIKIENRIIVIENDINNKKRMCSNMVVEADSPPNKRERKQITWP